MRPSRALRRIHRASEPHHVRTRAAVAFPRVAAPASIRCSRPVLVVLAVLVLLGGGLRAAKAASPDLGNPSTDEIAYADIARSLAHGQYHASLHWPPGAPAMFAVGQKLFPSKDLRAAYWLQALVGTLLIGAVFVLGLLAAGPAVGLGAAGLTAIYPPYLTLAGQLLSEPLGMLLLVAGVAALLAGWRLQRRWPFVLAGVLLGGTLLTRTDLLLVPGILAVATVLVLRREGRRPALTAAGLLLAATFVTVLPWVIFASSRANHFVPITEGSGSALFVGTYLPGEGTTTGMKRELGPEVQRSSRKYRHTEPTLIPAVVVLDHVARRRPKLDRDAALNAEGRRQPPAVRVGGPAVVRRDDVRQGVADVARVEPRGRRDQVERHPHDPLHRRPRARACCSSPPACCGAPPSCSRCCRCSPYGTLLHAVFVSKPRYALPLLPLLAVGGLAAAAALVEWSPEGRADAPARHALTVRQRAGGRLRGPRAGPPRSAGARARRPPRPRPARRAPGSTCGRIAAAARAPRRRRRRRSRGPRPARPGSTRSPRSRARGRRTGPVRHRRARGFVVQLRRRDGRAAEHRLSAPSWRIRLSTTTTSSTITTQASTGRRDPHRAHADHLAPATSAQAAPAPPWPAPSSSSTATSHSGAGRPRGERRRGGDQAGVAHLARAGSPGAAEAAARLRPAGEVAQHEAERAQHQPHGHRGRARRPATSAPARASSTAGSSPAAVAEFPETGDEQRAREQHTQRGAHGIEATVCAVVRRTSGGVLAAPVVARGRGRRAGRARILRLWGTALGPAVRLQPRRALALRAARGRDLQRRLARPRLPAQPVRA